MGAREGGRREARLPAGLRAWREPGRLLRDEAGAVAVIVALTFSAIFLAIAVAIDFARPQTDLVRGENTVAAAALAASHRLGLPDRDSTGGQDRDAPFEVNARTHGPIGVETEQGELYTAPKANVLTSLLKAVAGKTIGVGSRASAKMGRGTVEVALVLDNSAAMLGQSLTDLGVAAKNLTSVLFAGYEGSDKVKLAIVPFAGAVNVGAAQQGAAWIDSGGLSPVHYENFAEQRPRFQLFTELGVRWGGCVEVRPSPHDVTDSLPQNAVPASLFVPMFAPDEPDPANAEGHSYNNNYLADTGGRCVAPAPTCVQLSQRGRCTAWSTPTISAAEAQARTCKYGGGSIGSGPGPNALCDTQPILPLTENKGAVDAVIGQMRAKGSSNMLEGLMWGWRVLSPEAPFTEGRPYSDPENRKYLILMAHGGNEHQAVANPNRSSYQAFGYAANGRLGNSATTSALIGQLNSKTWTACENAKAAGITIYSIAFRLESDASTRALLASCASSAAEAYRASDGASLVQAFEAIAREIAKLRIAS